MPPAGLAHEDQRGPEQGERRPAGEDLVPVEPARTRGGQEAEDGPHAQDVHAPRRGEPGEVRLPVPPVEVQAERRQRREDDRLEDGGRAFQPDDRQGKLHAEKIAAHPASLPTRPPPRYLRHSPLFRTTARDRDAAHCRVPPRQQVVRRHPRRRPGLLLRPARRVLLPPRPQRLRQDHHAPPAGRLRDAGPRRRRGPHRRRGGQRPAPLRAPHRDGLPELRALSPPLGRAERRLRARGAPGPAHRDSGPGGAGARARPARAGHLRPPPAAPALRRPAAAGGAGPRPGARSRDPPPRRAARRPRPAAPEGDAARTEDAEPRARDDVRVRDPRPGGSARDVRPDRRHERRAGGASRHAGRHLRESADRVRRRVHRGGESVQRGGGAAGQRGRTAVDGDAAATVAPFLVPDHPGISRGRRGADRRAARVARPLRAGRRPRRGERPPGHRAGHRLPRRDDARAW